MDAGISRDESLALKGISIITVILAHACGWARAFSGVPVLGNANIVGFLCQGGMTLFLFLSGYGLFVSFLENGIERYWDNKIKKVYIPAAIIQLIWLIICCTFNGKSYFENEMSRLSFFSELLCINQNNEIDGSMWYLSYLLFCYLYFYFYVHIPIKNIAIVRCLYLILFALLSDFFWPYAANYVIAFPLGIMIANLLVKKQIIISRNICYKIIFLGSLVSVFYLKFLIDRNVFVENFASVELAGLLILTVKALNVHKFDFFVRLGKISFYVYLLEEKIIFDWINYENFSGVKRLLVFCILFILTIILSKLINELVLKIRMLGGKK